MMSDRRYFLKFLGLSLLATQLTATNKRSQSIASAISPQPILKPPRLKVGDTVALVSPASMIFKHELKYINLILGQQKLKVKVATHALDRYGYLAGKDIDRAADINAMFADDEVKALVTTRGGWGSSRILPLLDYDLIRKNPKIIIGYSDITALLLAIYARSGLLTFHGPFGTSTWNKFSVGYLKDILFAGKAMTLQPPTNIIVETITYGKARGRLVGGNLSVLTAMVGSNFLPDWRGKILFVEEIREDVYRVDRMLTQLSLAGVLQQLEGFVFAQCIKCLDEEDDFPTLTLWQVLLDRIQPLGIPAWYGTAIGHIRDKFTVPLGVEVEIDAGRGTIQMLENAVV
ncbi:MAG: LD-carboxypeptidase [Okeania sp. SIO3I5]|uniref:S66 peptidase family protein n=1 Tax=Okeania sp. SIO3I5 TaxID=2607805 RepID=UPI0013B7A6A3|nr:LD-carboxypeptidase [Okeania sp. SIO3I5]NEQ41236.1 LD-carboxypeptidase [Okeania sp. SIO3I5]